jgi:hypothetical protein
MAAEARERQERDDRERQAREQQQRLVRLEAAENERKRQAVSQQYQRVLDSFGAWLNPQPDPADERIAALEEQLAEVQDAPQTPHEKTMAQIRQIGRDWWGR